MFFIHLTDIRNADKIRKSGLLMGNRDAEYKYGGGVFCVPAATMLRWDQGTKRKYFPDGSRVEVVQHTRPASTDLLWKWWTKVKNIRRPAAVYFRAPKTVWPADMFLDIGEDWMQVHEFHGNIESERHLGTLLKLLAESGLVLRSWPAGIDLQVVFRKPIPPQYIHHIVPLSQKNVDFRKRKARIAARNYQWRRRNDLET